MTDETTDAKKLAETEVKAACDLVIERAAVCMVEEIGAPVHLMLDRLLTFAGAHACLRQGSPEAAKAFREMAGNIERGAFHAITGEGRQH